MKMKLPGIGVTFMAHDGQGEDALIEQAVSGHSAATELLLLGHYDKLAAEIAPLLPNDLKALISPDDVLQETFVVAFREIHTFIPNGSQAFHAWLRAIAKHRMLDMIKAQRCAKRGGGRVAIGEQTLPNDASTLACLLEQINVDTHTPSTSVAGHEVVRAIQIGLGGLKPDYREVLRLRYVERLPIAEIARRMERTDAAINALCHRALQQLRDVVGRASQFFSTQ